MLLIYRVLLYLGCPFLKIWIYWRMWKGKEDAARMQERFGYASYVRPKGPLFWFHGASIGESLTYLPLLRYFHKEYPDTQFLLTAGTRGAAQVLGQRLPDRCLFQYIPLDQPVFVKRFLHHWKPNACFWMEADFWPILLQESSQKMPLFLLNGRLSKKSFFFWKLFAKSFKKMLKCFQTIYSQTLRDSTRFMYFHTQNVEFLGNLKFSTHAVAPINTLEPQIVAILKKRPFWIASNTHKGEEEIVFQAHKILQRTTPNLLLILIPRHPHRTIGEIIPIMEKNKFSYAMRSRKESLTQENIYVADTMGEVLSFYKHSKIVFLGGSLFPHIGGHNILEPLAFHNFVLIGPHMENNTDLAEKALQKNICVQVQDAESLAAFIQKNLHNHNDIMAIESFLQENDVLKAYIKALNEKMEHAHVATT